MSHSPLPTPDASYSFTPRIMRWGFGAVMAVILLLTALSFWRGETDRRIMDEIVAHEQRTVGKLYQMQLLARDRTLTLYEIIHAEDGFEQGEKIRHFNTLEARFRTIRAQLEQLPLSETEREALAQQRAQAAQILPLMAHVIERVKSGQHDEADKIMVAQVVPAQTRMIGALTALLESASGRTRERVAAVRQTQSHATVLFIVGELGGVLLISGIFMLLTRKMGTLIRHLAETNQLLNKSHLNLQFQKSALDEHNILSIADRHGIITEVNEKFCTVSGYSREALLGQNHRLLKSDWHPAPFYDALWETISSGQVWHGEICNRRKDGSLYWVASTILPFLGEDGLPVQYVSVRTDITAIKEAQAVLERSHDELEQLVATRTNELAEREEVLHSITRTAQDAVILIDQAGRVTYWNPAAEHMFGFTETEVMGENLHDLIVPDHTLAQAHAGFRHFSRSGEGPALGKTTTLQAKRRNGEAFPVDISLSSFKLREQWSAVGIVRDATERMNTEERLKQLATTDALTGICNRRCFDETLEREVGHAARFATPLSLILFDIDHFKRINDAFGHPTGDQVLAQMAGAVGGTIRITDLFARWGGEEFAVLLPGSCLNDGRVLAEKLRRELEKQPFPEVGHITCSFGVAEYAPGDTADGLMKKADLCMYQAKASGRNRVNIHRPIPLRDAS